MILQAERGKKILLKSNRNNHKQVMEFYYIYILGIKSKNQINYPLLTKSLIKMGLIKERQDYYLRLFRVATDVLKKKKVPIDTLTKCGGDAFLRVITYFDEKAPTKSVENSQI